MNDFYMLDPSTNTWSDLTNNISGQRPSPRSGHGFASANNKLFIFGGYNPYEYYNGYSGESVRGVERKAWGSGRVCVAWMYRGCLHNLFHFMLRLTCLY